MVDLFQTAFQVQQFIEEQNWRFCFIGGLALQRWGENRLTRDIDLTLFAGFDKELSFIQPLVNRYQLRRPDGVDFALTYRVLLLEDNRIGLDISLAGLEFEEELIGRSSVFDFLPGVLLRTCSAEDLVVLKAFASRPQDWVDIRGILVRQGSALDRQVIIARLSPLAELKEEPELVDRLRLLYTEA